MQGEQLAAFDFSNTLMKERLPYYELQSLPCCALLLILQLIYGFSCPSPETDSLRDRAR